MSKSPPDKQLLMDWFYRHTFPKGTLQFDDYLAEAAVEALGKSREDAQAYTQGNRIRIWNCLKKQSESDQKEGLFPILLEKDDNSRRFAWYAHELESRGDSKAKRRSVMLKARPHLLNAIDSMTPRGFEALGCVVCDLIGAETVELTPRGNEGGIDFFGLVIFPSKAHVFGGTRAKVRIVGQSKKYTTRVSVDRVRDFITTIEQVKHRSEALKYPLPQWFAIQKGPILGWMISHKGFQSGAITLARNHGISLSTSIDITEISALSRQLNQWADPQIRANELGIRVVQGKKHFQP